MRRPVSRVSQAYSGDGGQFREERDALASTFAPVQQQQFFQSNGAVSRMVLMVCVANLLVAVVVLGISLLLLGMVYLRLLPRCNVSVWCLLL